MMISPFFCLISIYKKRRVISKVENDASLIARLDLLLQNKRSELSFQIIPTMYLTPKPKPKGNLLIPNS